MAISSPSGTQNTVANPGNKPARWRPFWRLVWRLAVTAILGAIGAAAGFYTDSLLQNLPRLPEQMRDAPGVVRGVVIAVVVIVIALVIASYFWGKKADEDEEDTISPKLDELATTGQEIKQQVTDIAARLTSEALAIPAAVLASSLPRPVKLIGRDDQLRDLMAALRAGKSSSVVALEGMGGVGKTALAAEAVARLATSGDFPGRAVWISVAGLTGASGLAEVWTRIGGELGLQQQLAPLTDAETRRRALRGELEGREPTLLALDNVERDLDANALLDTLAVEGHTTLLLTSRFTLAPQRLTTITLRPLPAPDAETLFRDRLRRIDTSRPNAEDEASIPTLATLVGGLPLAVELVAAYVGVQHRALASVLAELREKGLDAAAFDDPLYPQRALLATFEQSWTILTLTQQQLFAGLSLLAESSFPRDVALAIAAATEPPASEGDLAALVSYALVEPLADERQRLHPLLREYAAQKLETLPETVAASLGQAMAAYWIAFARDHPDYEGMDALEAENDGLMGALTWAHNHQQHEALLALSSWLSFYWFVRGRINDARLALPWALEAAQVTKDQSNQRFVLHDLAVLKSRTGDIVSAQEFYEQALTLARQLQDPAEEQIEIHELAVLKGETGDLAGARAGYEAALALARQLHDLSAERYELHGLAELKRKLGDLKGACIGFEEALVLARQLHDPSAERAELHGLALIKAQTGDPAGAQAGFEEALVLARQLHDPEKIAVELRNLGIFIGQNGQPERGRTLVEEALALATQLGDPSAIGYCHQFLAWFDEQENNRAGAISHYRRALRHFEQARSPDAEEVRRDLHALGEDA